MVKIETNGGYRYIGSNLCEQPVAKNLEVVVIDDLSTGLKSNLVNFESTFHKSYQNKKNVSLKKSCFDLSTINVSHSDLDMVTLEVASYFILTQFVKNKPRV
jgi:UDP-glucose 4-epimerase